MFKYFIIVLVYFVSTSETARILAIFPTPSVSHQIVYQPVLKELINRGHEVVSITPNPMNDSSLPNITEIYMDMAYDHWKKTFNFALGRHYGYGSKDYTHGLFEGMTILCEHILAMPEVTRLIEDPNETFDLVMVEWIFCPSMAMFSYRFQAPLVAIASFHAFLSGHDNVGNPTHPIYSPDFFLPFANNMNFWKRLYSTYYNFWYRWYFYFHVLPVEDQMARKHFGNDVPYLGDVVNSLSLLLTNTHPILGGPRPLVPTTVEIGGTGLHIKPRKPLPKDLQKYLDDATEGVIYFSLGSNVKSVALNDEKRNAILSAFSEMPYKILWKWESDTLPGLPKNVKIQQWFPQRDILEHANVKAFLTQGGLQSFEEAVLNKIPLVGMPFFADQDYNVDKMVYLGIAERLEVNTLTKDDVKTALTTVINDERAYVGYIGYMQMKRRNIVHVVSMRIILPTQQPHHMAPYVIQVASVLESLYKQRIADISKMVYDQPMKSLDLAVWWIEYVLRHNGTRQLRSPAVDTPIYQHFHLDILAFLIACTLIISYSAYIVLIYCSIHVNKYRQDMFKKHE